MKIEDEVKFEDSDLTSEKEENEEENEEEVAPEEEPIEEPPVDIPEEILELRAELAKINVYPPHVPLGPDETLDLSEFPQSYHENNGKEQKILDYAENFRQQFVHLYRDRRPLLMKPVNECGVEKFVCTSLRATELPFQELYNWDGAANFVADYLERERLVPATELPKRLVSSYTILRRQKGNCLDYATLLCSLLLGVGYDAYVVSGYATKETCEMDERLEICPLLQPKVEQTIDREPTMIRKYAVSNQKKLSSKFDAMLEDRKHEEERKLEEDLKKEEEEKIQELEKLPVDPLYGRRVHVWVLVLAGKREVPANFFIEPFTGLSYVTTSSRYLGIESIWNNTNYWVNMQDCSQGLTHMSYDLTDNTRWEFVFPGAEKTPTSAEDFLDEIEEDDDNEEIEKHLDMPSSWTLPIVVTRKDFETRCPLGKKTKFYKKAKLEKFAPYLLPDGLTCRLSIYDDYELTSLKEVREMYENRKDKLYSRVHDHVNGWIIENYARGRSHHIKEMRYKATTTGFESDRETKFYSDARVDGLLLRVETPLSLTEHFQDRNDRLFYRHAEFKKRVKKFGPADSSGQSRAILKMVERFERNKAVNADDDIRELDFLTEEGRYLITYHSRDAYISTATREFIKPPKTEEQGMPTDITSDMHFEFRVDPTGKPKKKVELFQLLEHLMNEEENCRMKIRTSEDEIKEILEDRVREESNSELEISVYDTERNEKAKRHRKELERQAAEERAREAERELDYLAPFLAQRGDPERISRDLALKLRNDCLMDLKQRLIDKANLIQARFEKAEAKNVNVVNSFKSETQELQKKQEWYQQNQISMTKEDEEEYLNYCSDAMFRIHILELRLNRHKETAPIKYANMEQKLHDDQRLKNFL